MRTACGSLKDVRDSLQSAVREAVNLAGRGRKYQAEQMIMRAHARAYHCARSVGHPDVSHWSERGGLEGWRRRQHVKRRQYRRRRPQAE
jgi:hypothetical protein